MTAISVSERLLEMAAFYTPLALTVTIFFRNPQLFKALNFCRFFKTHTPTHTGKGAESTGQGQTGIFLSGPVFFAIFTASAG